MIGVCTLHHLAKVNRHFGNVLLPDLLRMPRGVFVVCFAAVLTALLQLLQQFTTR